MNSDVLQIAVLQFDITWQQQSENMRHVSDCLSTLNDVDVCVLPEMWTTGFVTSPSESADINNNALTWMREQAACHNMALCGTVCIGEKVDNKYLYYNRMFFVSPDGNYVSYDKRHLFTMGGEHIHYVPGDKRVVVSHRGFRLLLATCYDLRFPVWLRNNDDYDGMIVCANWPEPRRSVWDVLLKARALENQCYVIACNRTGKDVNVSYNGGSVIIDPKGNILAQAKDGMEECVQTNISLSTRQSFIKKFNTLADRDSFELNTHTLRWE